MTSVSRTARGGPATSLKRSAQRVQRPREGVRRQATTLAALLERQHRGERDLPVARTGQLLRLEPTGVDQSHNVLTREAQPISHLLGREQLALLRHRDSNMLPLVEEPFDLLGDKACAITRRRIQMNRLHASKRSMSCPTCT